MPSLTTSPAHVQLVVVRSANHLYAVKSPDYIDG
ncbi:hypothetical protein H4W33_006470 [Kibdelosporangium phytohabitans]|nr:hypothetical protein [Kibdelosporangium phytohabitans]